MLTTVNMVWPEILMFNIFVLAIYNGYGYDFQVRQLRSPPPTYLTFLGNWTNWLAILLVNPLTGYLMMKYSGSWDDQSFYLIFALAWGGGLLMTLPLLADSRKTPSAYYQAGRMTFAGLMYHFFMWPYQVTVFAAFYVLSPRASIPMAELSAVTGMLFITWGVSTLQPPIMVHGHTNKMAWIGALLGWTIIASGFIYQMQ